KGQPPAERGRHASDPAAAGADSGIRAFDFPALPAAQARLRPAALERPLRRLRIFSPLFHAGAGPLLLSPRFFTSERGPCYFLPAFSRRSGAPVTFSPLFHAGAGPLLRETADRGRLSGGAFRLLGLAAE